MKNWESTLIETNATLLTAIERLNESAKKICLVVDGERRLIGTVTDGDIRRAIMAKAPMESDIKGIMRRNPMVVRPEDSDERVRALATTLSITHFPVCDSSGRVVGIRTIEDLLANACQGHDNWVVLLAGGLGKRLGHLTKDIPKPLLKVGRKPLLETIVENFVRAGFRNIFLSVNFKADMIIEYFGDGSAWGANIRYLQENQPLGTGGALGLLPERPDKPVLVMNGDILTTVDFGALLNFHLQHDGAGTMCVREYDVQVPFGVVKVDGAEITGIEEKPLHRHLINTGLYVVNPEMIDLIPKGEAMDMPDLFRRITANPHLKAMVYPIREYWIDIGRIEDFDRANSDIDWLKTS